MMSLFNCVLTYRLTETNDVSLYYPPNLETTFFLLFSKRVLL